MHQYKCFFHGTAQPNPGKIGCGIVVLDQDEREVIRASVLGGSGTNNIAAYKALTLAMELCLKARIESVHIFGDSQVVINQVLGEWVVNNETFMPFHAKAQELGTQLHCNLTWVKKANNQRACELSQLAVRSASDSIFIDPCLLESRPQQESDHQEEDTQHEQDELVEHHGDHNPSPVPHNGSSHQTGAERHKVIVKGLAGGKVAFIYGQAIQIYDLVANHCTCGQFQINGECEHALAIKRATMKKAS